MKIEANTAPELRAVPVCYYPRRRVVITKPGIGGSFMAEPREIDVAAVIERAKFGGLQLRVVVLCALVIILDGFDLLVIALTAPAIAADWGLAGDRLGPLFGIGLLGMILGSVLVAPLGDRYGRRFAILLSVTLFGIFAGATALAETYGQLMLLRLLTGIGLGGAVPNCTALISEYAPDRHRAIMVTFGVLGFAVGGLLCSTLAVPVIPAFGWRAMYVLGGLLPLALVPALLWALPESIRFLVIRRGRDETVAATLTRIEPTGNYSAADRFLVPAVPTGVRLKRLFDEGRGPDTLRLWLIFFINMMVLFYLVNWIPYLAVHTGFSDKQASLATLGMTLGGILGPLVLAMLVRRHGSRLVISRDLALGAVALTAVGFSTPWFGAFVLAATAAGFFVFGAQIAIHALAANIYPTDARATGLGWALACGRVGSIIGPLLGGELLRLGADMRLYFAGFGLLLLIGAAATFTVQHDDRPKN